MQNIISVPHLAVVALQALRLRVRGTHQGHLHIVTANGQHRQYTRPQRRDLSRQPAFQPPPHCIIPQYASSVL